MTSYRQMRRQARQARRAGMQPMMVINSGDPFPELAFVVISRCVWRYRSELAPLGAALAVAGLGWYTHAAFAAFWPAVLAGSGAAAWLLAAFGGKLGIPVRLERLYAAVTLLACGAWVAAAAVLGHSTAPLPQVLGIGVALLAVPWWANRSRRAKVRVERDHERGHGRRRLPFPVPVCGQVLGTRVQDGGRVGQQCGGFGWRCGQAADARGPGLEFHATLEIDRPDDHVTARGEVGDEFV